MDPMTVSRPGDWDAAVLTFKARVVPCESCGRPRRESPHPHAPRWHRVEGRYVVVDCVGREVAR